MNSADQPGERIAEGRLSRQSLPHVRNFSIAAAGAVPLLGGPLQYLLDSYLPGSVEGRWLTFLEELNERLSRLENPPALDDERVVSSFLRASRISVGTHLEGKIGALAAAVEGVIDDPDRFSDELVERFFFMIERFTPRHIEVMSLLRDNVEPKGGHYEEYEDYVLEKLRSVDFSVADDATREAIARDLDDFDLIQYIPATDPRLLSDEGVLFLDFLRFFEVESEGSGKNT